MPISFFEGLPENQRSQLKGRNMERRFFALAAAVRDHEAASRRSTPASRARDERLYLRLRQIAGEQAAVAEPTAEVPAA